MCGIAAVADRSGSRSRLLARILAPLVHRGDARHAYEVVDDPAAGLAMGAHRLPIVGAAVGRQPVSSPDGAVTVVLNGEIYNYRALRAQLAAGDGGPPGNDTHVLAAALGRWGVARTLPRLDWEGAFVALDRGGGRVVAARDPIGVKPLYRMRTDSGALCFASEIKALVGHPGAGDVVPLPAGASVSFPLASSGEEQTAPYWELPSGPAAAGDAPGDPRETAERLADLLRGAVRARIPDFPYAIALSGGVDSSAVVALAAEEGTPFVAYTLQRPGSTDGHHAAELCRRLGVPQVTVPAPSPRQLGRELADVVREAESWEWHVVTHSGPMRALTSAIRADGHKVVLSGEGADELFAGYPPPDPPTPAQVVAERRRRLAELPRTNCRRLDRIGMARTLEFRTPYLSREVVECALGVPPEQLVTEATNKAILRRAVAAWLPSSIVWRPKVPLARGAGYDYGHGPTEALIQPPPDAAGDGGPVPAGWVDLPRSPAERHYLSLFCGYGYHVAPYLRSRTI